RHDPLAALAHRPRPALTAASCRSSSPPATRTGRTRLLPTVATIRPMHPLASLSMLTTNQKGALAEAKITAAALALGIGVLRPLGDERFDLILDLRPRLISVQCNWTVQRGSVVVVTCRTNRRGPDGFIRRTYESGEIDAIAAYCAANDECYLLPLELSVATPGVQLRLAPTLNN